MKRFRALALLISAAVGLSGCGGEDGGDPAPAKPDGGGGGGGGDPVVGAARGVNQARAKLKNMGVLKQYAMGAMMAASVEGGIAATLEAVREAGDLPDDLTLTNTETGETGVEPIYFSKKGELLLAAPFVNPDGTRTVANADGSVVHIPEEEYQKKAEAQK